MDSTTATDAPFPVLWTNDDIKAGKANELRNMLAFLDRHGIPGVFFVIPKAGGNIAEDPALLRVIDQGRENGHEFYPHGFAHTPFDHGLPPLLYMCKDPDLCKQYDGQRLAIEREHTFEAQVRRVEATLKIWRQAFHEESPGYRAPWCATSLGFYRALDALGVQWSSSSVHGITWHKYSCGQWDAPLEYNEGVPARPHQILGDVVEYPMPGDYSPRHIRGAEQVERFVDLALADFAHFRARNAPFVICSHWFCLEKDGCEGYKVHDALMPRLLAMPGVAFTGMRQLHAERARFM